MTPNKESEIEMSIGTGADIEDEWQIVDRAGNVSTIPKDTDTAIEPVAVTTAWRDSPKSELSKKQVVALCESPFTMVNKDETPPTKQHTRLDIQQKNDNHLKEALAKIPAYCIPPKVSHSAVHRELDNLWHHRSRYPELYDWREWNALAKAICKKHGRDVDAVRMQRRLKGVN